MVFYVKIYRHYLLLGKVVIFVDHMTLRYLVNKPNLNGRIYRWIFLLQEFDYKVEYKPEKMHVQADHLSRISERKATGSDDEFPDAALFTISTARVRYNHVADYLSTQSMLEVLSKVERRKVWIQSRYFTLISGTTGMLRRCIDHGKVPKVLEAAHDSPCGGYFAGMLTAQKTHQAI